MSLLPLQKKLEVLTNIINASTDNNGFYNSAKIDFNQTLEIIFAYTNIKFTDKPIIKFLIGASIGCVFRYFFHVLSGYYVFSSWAMPGYSAVGWSFIYNLYVIADLAIVIEIGCAVFASKSFVRQLDSLSKKK